MKNIFNKLVLFSVLFSLSICNTITFANTNIKNEDEISNQVIINSLELAEILSTINEIYLNDVDNNKIIEGAIDGIINALNDKHSRYFTKEQYKNFLKNLQQSDFNIGFIYKVDKNGSVVIDEIIPNTYSEKYDLKVGDKILRINGKTVTGNNLKSIILENINNGIYKLDILISRDDIYKNILMNINEDDLKTVIYKDINEFNNIDNPKNDVCYIKISNIGDKTEQEFTEVLKKVSQSGKNKLILDLRGNTGGYFETAINICKQIVPKGTIVSTRNKNNDIKIFKSDLENPPFKKIAVLTDSLTASSAEIIASAIKDSGIGFTVGRRTYGKGTIQDIIEVYTGGAIKLTTGEYYSRNGNKINNIGIKPTFLVSPVLFISEDLDLNSRKFKEAMDYIGFSELTLSDIQKNNGLKVTNKLDKDTVNFINNRIYKVSILNDNILLKAYNEIIK